MLPKYPKKNADAIIEWVDGKKWVVDFKYMDGNGSHIYKRLSDAHKQAVYAIIKMTGEIDKSQVKHISDKFMTEHNQFKGIVIYDNKDNLIYKQII